MAVAPDGSPVALYLALPGDADARSIHGAIPEAADVLELGCGVGRVTRHLAELGHAVTGVDNSQGMLAAFPRLAGVQTILADIASLELRRRFRSVVLASHLINGEAGATFLRAAAHHVTDDGVVLIQRHAPGWVDSAQPVSSEWRDVRLELIDVSHPQAGVMAATAVYTVAGIIYQQPFVAHEVDDERLANLARQVGLCIDGYVDGDPRWVKLVPVASPAEQLE